MSVVLVRVDDRLIHGQVVIGWGRAIRAERIVLIDDAIADSAWEQELYRMGVPPDMDVEFASVAQAGGEMGTWMADATRTILLLADVETLARLCAAAREVADVNLGGVHHRDGRRERLPYVFLADDEIETLKALRARGVSITAQDVPTARPVPLAELE